MPPAPNGSSELRWALSLNLKHGVSCNRSLLCKPNESVALLDEVIPIVRNLTWLRK